MDTRKFIICKTLILLVGEAVCVAAMCGIYALLRRFDLSVLLGGIVGAVLGTGNFFLMALSADQAADRAQQQDAAAGKSLIKTSYMLRLVGLFVILFAFAKSGVCNVLAMVLPLAFVRPIIMISEFFRKSGDEGQ